MNAYFCHSRAGGNPIFSKRFWIPASAGMTGNNFFNCVCINYIILIQWHIERMGMFVRMSLFL